MFKIMTFKLCVDNVSIAGDSYPVDKLGLFIKRIHVTPLVIVC